MTAEFTEQPIWSDAEGGKASYCQHGVDCQVHCCFCHNGFLFDGMQHAPECPYYHLLGGEMNLRRETIKKGIDEWWAWTTMLHVAKSERKRLKLPPTAAVTIDVQLCNRFIESIDRNPAKRLWILFTNGDLHPLGRGKIAIKAEDGIVRKLFRK